MMFLFFVEKCRLVGRAKIAVYVVITYLSCIFVY